MNIPKKTISWGLLGHIGVQACAVSAGLAYHYSQPQIAPIVITIKASRYSVQDILYGVIMKPQLNHPTDSSQSHTKKLGITLIGTTTGTNTDCTFVIPV